MGNASSPRDRPAGHVEPRRFARSRAIGRCWSRLLDRRSRADRESKAMVDHEEQKTLATLAAADVMTTAPLTCSKFSTVLEAVMIFRDADCGAVPVLDE